MKTNRMLRPAGVVLAAAMAMAISTPLHAGDDTGGNSDAANPTFQKLDTNRDGYVSRDEAAKLRGFDQVFNDADGNRDGRLDKDEFLKAQAAYDGMRAKAFIDDSMITARIKAALLKDKEVSALAVSVETDKGIVLLSGFVENEKQVLRAQEIAAAIKGVKSVKSNLVVKS